MDQGTAVGLQATGIGITLGALLYTGHARAMQRVQEDREAREWAAYEGSLHARIVGLEHDLAAAERRIAELERELALKTLWVRAANKRMGL